MDNDYNIQTILQSVLIHSLIKLFIYSQSNQRIPFKWIVRPVIRSESPSKNQHIQNTIKYLMKETGFIKYNYGTDCLHMFWISTCRGRGPVRSGIWFICVWMWVALFPLNFLPIFIQEKLRPIPNGQTILETQMSNWASAPMTWKIGWVDICKVQARQFHCICHLHFCLAVCLLHAPHTNKCMRYCLQQWKCIFFSTHTVGSTVWQVVPTCRDATHYNVRHVSWDEFKKTTWIRKPITM